MCRGRNPGMDYISINRPFLRTIHQATTRRTTMEMLKQKKKVTRSQVSRLNKIPNRTSAVDLEEVSVLIERLRLAERQLIKAQTLR
ncbi:hypothetical protein MRX96_036100 [Rhipicephalus microplus]